MNKLTPFQNAVLQSQNGTLKTLVTLEMTQKIKDTLKIFTGTWYNSTPNYHQALFLANNLKGAKKYAQIYKKRNNLKSATIVTKN